MINIAVIDDEKETRDLILQILNNSNQLVDLQFSCKPYTSGEAFLECQENNIYDILILDIEMTGVSGVDLAKQLKNTHKNLIIVFLTSYEHYMKDAFGLNVHNYSLKENMLEELPIIIRSLLLDAQKNKIKITFNTNYGLVGIYEDDIVCVVFENRSPVVYTKNVEMRVYGESLHEVYERLSIKHYVQPNSGTIVNIKYIKSIQSSTLFLRYYEPYISISRSRFKAVKQKHIEFLAGGESL